MEKAAREAKQQTSWTQQNKEFEDALKLFIERLLDSQQFTADLEEFVARLLMPGRINSLSQTLIKFTAPGMPDTYQGGELWDLRLVDPDNRGPVDYELRQSMLAELREWNGRRRNPEGNELWPTQVVGYTYSALQLRREKPELLKAKTLHILQSPSRDRRKIM